MVFGWLLAIVFLGIIAGGIALAIVGSTNKHKNRSKIGLGIAGTIIG